MFEGKTIATRLGSTSSDFIKENIEGAIPNEYERLDQAYLAVENGSACHSVRRSQDVAYSLKQRERPLKLVGELVPG